MKKVSLYALFLFVFVVTAFAQREEYTIKRVDLSMALTPQYSTNPTFKQSRSANWLVIDVTFEARPEFTEELVFNYYVAFKGNDPDVRGKVFVGRVHHINIPKGTELHSAAFMSPRTLARLVKGKPFNISDIDMVTVTITKPGIAAPISAKGTSAFTPNWWASFQAVEGAVLNKNETPFAPLAWDYYEAIKPTPAR